MNPYFIFDFETGGLNSSENAITEIAAIGLNPELEEVGRLQFLVKDYGLSYHPKALEVTGITKSLLSREGENIVNVAKAVQQFCSDLIVKSKCDKTRGKPIIVAHNAQFDLGFLQQLYEACALDISKSFYCTKDFYGNNQPHYIDTIDLAKLRWSKRKGEINSYKLSSCVNKAGIQLSDAHRAMADTEALKDLFIYLQTNNNESNNQQNKGVIQPKRKTFQF